MKLREGESIVHVAEYHWSYYIVPAFFFALGILALLGALVDKTEGAVGQTLPGVLLFCSALPYYWVYAKTKKFIVTSQRVYVSEGILARKTTDVPFQKINDIHMNQGLIERLFGSGTVEIFTGHSKPTRLKRIDNPEAFKDAVSKVTSKSSSEGKSA